MDYYRVVESIYSIPSFPNVTWKLDAILDQPILTSPNDQDVVCPENFSIAKGGASGLVLDWAVVSGATKYIVQWCENSSFHGPTLRAVIVSNTYYELKAIDEINYGDTIYWRVMAIDEAGGVSEKSEARAVKYECIFPQGGKGGRSGARNATYEGTRQDLCDLFQVKIDLRTSARVALACETIYAVIDYSYSCYDEDGTQVVSLQNVAWTLKADPNNPATAHPRHTGILRGIRGQVVPGTGDRLYRMDIDCDWNQNFTVRVALTFKHIPTDTTFVCMADKEVLVDVDYGNWDYKPWGNFIDRDYITGYAQIIDWAVDYAWFSDVHYGPREIFDYLDPMPVKDYATHFIAGPVFIVDQEITWGYIRETAGLRDLTGESKCFTPSPRSLTILYEKKTRTALEARIPILIPCFLVELTSDLAAGSFTTATSATAKILRRKRGETTDNIVAESPEKIETIFSTFDAEFSAGDHLIVIQDGYGDFWVVAADCA